MSVRSLPLVLAILIGTLASVPHALATEQPTADALHAAAREGDITAVTALLDAGLEVDSPNRYGATALTFAAEKGRLEVVKLLLVRGAAPDPRDRFYNQTPLGWARTGLHHEIVTLLLERGAAGAGDVLIDAIPMKRQPVIDAALRHGLYGWERAAALELARRLELDAIVAQIEASETKPPQATVEVPASELGAFAAAYEAGGGARQLVIAVRDGALWLDEGEQPAVRLRAVGDRVFRAVDDEDRSISFFGRSGSVEGLIYQSRALRIPFTPTEEVAEEVQVGSAEPADQEAATFARTAARPWPSFRGVAASGVADGQGAVARWDVGTGENVLWKTRIPGLGHASPIVWGDRVYVATAVSGAGDESLRPGHYGDFAVVDDLSEHRWQVAALDKDSGEIVWQTTIATAKPLTTRHLKSTQANSTPVTDGERIVAVFPTAGLVCLDTDGTVLWHNDLGALDAGWFYDRSYQWGFASSPILYRDTVILQVDVHDGAYIAAFDLSDGRERWRTARDEIPTWATPTIYHAPDGGQDELITNGTIIRGYDPVTGRELWRLGPNSEVIIATPVIADGLVYVTASYPPVRTIYAVRLGSRGDLTLPGDERASDAIAWSYHRGGAYMPSPLVYRGIYYIGHHNGRLSAYDAVTGERVYRARFSKGGAFTGSPVAADGKLYFSTEDGRVYVVKAGPTYEELATMEMDEVLMTTPAISDGTIFLRTAKHLWAIGETPTTTGAAP